MSFAQPLLILSLLAAAPFALQGADLDREYEQIRKIALRDKKVQEAFERANERLDEKIISLDPALTAYVRAYPSGRAPRPAPSRPSPTRAKPAPAPAAKKNSPPPASGRAYTVKPGDTLTGIASKQGVSVQKIQATNKIPDAGKLKAGQVLVIPTTR